MVLIYAGFGSRFFVDLSSKKLNVDKKKKKLGDGRGFVWRGDAEWFIFVSE